MEKIIAFFSAVLMFFGYVIGTEIPDTTNEVKYIGQDRVFGIQSIPMGQGITADENYYYTSGSLANHKSGLGVQFLAKWTADSFIQVGVNLDPIPYEYEKSYHLNHIGGISCANGIIYASVEGQDYSKNFIFLYDAKTLKFIKAYDVSCEYLDDGIPWVAIDSVNGYAYTSRWGKDDFLVRYNLDDFTFSGVVNLSEPIERIQGGEFFDGKLFLSRDVSKTTEEIIYEVDVNSGSIKEAFRTTLKSPDNESEDIAIYPRKDGSLFHILNYDKIIGVNIIHLAPENDT